MTNDGQGETTQLQTANPQGKGIRLDGRVSENCTVMGWDQVLIYDTEYWINPLFWYWILPSIVLVNQASTLTPTTKAIIITSQNNVFLKDNMIII